MEYSLRQEGGTTYIGVGDILFLFRSKQIRVVREQYCRN